MDVFWQCIKAIYDIGTEIIMLQYFDCLPLEIWSYRQILDTSWFYRLRPIFCNSPQAISSRLEHFSEYLHATLDSQVARNFRFSKKLQKINFSKLWAHEKNEQVMLGTIPTLPAPETYQKHKFLMKQCSKNEHLHATLDSQVVKIFKNPTFPNFEPAKRMSRSC